MKDLFLISGASTGIGFALAEHFAKQGHHVLAGVRSQKDQEKLKAIANVEPIILDIAKAEDLEKVPALLKERISNYRKLVLINNAGIAVGGPWEILPESQVRKQFEVNVFGLIFLTQKCLPYIRQTKGHVFNISSVSGLFSLPFLGLYASSKFAIEAFSDSLRREMMKFGASVTSINPGPIKTPIWDKGMVDATKDFADDPIYGKVIKKFGESAAESARTALSVEAVVEVVDKAYRAKKAPPRVIVTTFEKKLSLKMLKYLPEQIVDSFFK